MTAAGDEPASTGDDGTTLGLLRRAMRGRDPGEANRASTPLEALFDLCFVVAVSQAATQLHEAFTGGQIGAGLLGYVAVFFAIWWAWLNFAWFASAYDTDDVPYRLLTLLQMAGVLVLAAGVPAAFRHYDFTVIVVGYVIMRMAMVSQWLRAAAEHPAGRPAALRYATGVAVVQVAWVLRLWAPGVWAGVTFLLCVLAELAVPVWAEHRSAGTGWHPGHIADRYSLFTIIVLGEVILATLAAVQDALGSGGLSTMLLLTVLGGLLLVFGLWWVYFSGTEATLRKLPVAMTWGYAHYLVFASIAALGAGLNVAVDGIVEGTGSSTLTVGLTVAIPVALTMLVLLGLQRLTRTGAIGHPLLVVVGAVLVLALGFSPPVFGIGGAVLGMGLALAATLAANLVVFRRRAVQAA